MDYVITGINARRILRSIRASRSDFEPLSWRDSVGMIDSGAYTPLSEIDCTRLGMEQAPTMRHPLSIIVPNAKCRIERHDEISCHVVSSILPGKPFLKVSPGFCIAGPELLFIDAASTMDFPSLLLFGMELCGTYSHRQSYPKSGRTVYQVEPATNAEKIRETIKGCSGARLRGSRAASLAARFLMDRAASPMESVLALMLRLPRSQGGVAFGIPKINVTIPIEDEYRHLTKAEGFTPDLFFEDYPLDIEYESEEFHPELGNWSELDEESRCAIEEKQRDDKRRMRLIQTLGIRVFQTTYDDFKTADDFEKLIEQLFLQAEGLSGISFDAKRKKLVRIGSILKRSMMLNSLLQSKQA